MELFNTINLTGYIQKDLSRDYMSTY